MNKLRDSRHDDARAMLRSVGPAIAGIGLLLTVVGIAGFVNSIGTSEPPRRFWCAIVGLPIMGIGLWISQFAFIGTITRYLAGEVAPVGKDMTNYMVAGTKDSIRDVAAAVGEGLSAAANGDTIRGVRCLACNTENDLSANFCDSCGAALIKSRPCEKCGEQNDADARFCDNCGTPVA
jgi:hypothetical protein